MNSITNTLKPVNSLQSSDTNPKVDIFGDNLKTIFNQYSTKSYLTDPEKESLKIILQELEEELASPLNHQESLSSIPKEIAELFANDASNFLLHSSIANNKMNLTTFLLAHPQIDINKANNGGWTPLHSACQDGYKEIVQLLLAHPQIDINKADNDGSTPLYEACMNGHREIVQLLLAHPQIDINKAGYSGFTPLNCACYRGDKEIVQLLLAIPQIDINKPGNSGWTPLMSACWWGYKEIVQLLLAQPQIDINKADNDGSTPLYEACHKGHKEIVENLLLERSINVNIYVDDTTPFSMAQQSKWHQITEVLNNCFGVDANTTKENGVVTAQQSVLSYVLSKDDPKGEWTSFKHLAREKSLLFSSRLFGLTVFLCDDFLALNPNATAADPAFRFFKIAKELPMELQMVLAHRTFHSMKNNIPSKDSEAAFKYLAKTFSLTQPPV